ncbi:hypothetical protein K443DRAFT_125988 [Laccaria amethystina LaAM-08-1]|uniref:Uncharacterized protein n=1 Tax=Laccaria amethystina LaAM-08-1 TaxID=1095629 RepID=A0A0C9X3P2_9AGAR|nr:hypothetical protein K443DRAFT_125988 [Laccaria amethystina LaAM-08-1]
MALGDMGSRERHIYILQLRKKLGSLRGVVKQNLQHSKMKRTTRKDCGGPEILATNRLRIEIHWRSRLESVRPTEGKRRVANVRQQTRALAMHVPPANLNRAAPLLSPIALLVSPQTSTEFESDRLLVGARATHVKSVFEQSISVVYLWRGNRRQGPRTLHWMRGRTRDGKLGRIDALIVSWVVIVPTWQILRCRERRWSSTFNLPPLARSTAVHPYL